MQNPTSKHLLCPSQTRAQEAQTPMKDNRTPFAHPLTPKYEAEWAPVHLVPSDPVAQAIIKFYWAMNWRRNTFHFSVGDDAMERAFMDLLAWVFGNARARERMLNEWIGYNYIADWPEELSDPAVRKLPDWERYPLRTMHMVAIRKRNERIYRRRHAVAP